MEEKREKNYRLINMEDVEVREVNWLWYSYIPFGKLTIVQGDPREGKTTLILHLAALLTKGEALPCEETADREGAGEIKDCWRMTVIESHSPAVFTLNLQPILKFVIIRVSSQLLKLFGVKNNEFVLKTFNVDMRADRKAKIFYPLSL